MKNKKIKSFCYLRLFLPALFILISFSLSYSQSGWFSQPPPVTEQVNDFKFFDAKTGLIDMWEPCLILKTTNGRYNWSTVYATGRQVFITDTSPVYGSKVLFKFFYTSKYFHFHTN